jgi:hypothetical protein
MQSLPGNLADMHTFLPTEKTFYDAAEYIDTSSGNKISRRSVLCGSQNIHLNGKVRSTRVRSVAACPSPVLHRPS